VACMPCEPLACMPCEPVCNPCAIVCDPCTPACGHLGYRPFRPFGGFFANLGSRLAVSHCGPVGCDPCEPIGCMPCEPRACMPCEPVCDPCAIVCDPCAPGCGSFGHRPFRPFGGFFANLFTPKYHHSCGPMCGPIGCDPCEPVICNPCVSCQW
jgi:hypothetical protein